MPFFYNQFVTLSPGESAQNRNFEVEACLALTFTAAAVSVVSLVLPLERKLAVEECSLCFLECSGLYIYNIVTCELEEIIGNLYPRCLFVM